MRIGHPQKPVAFVISLFLSAICLIGMAAAEVAPTVEVLASITGLASPAQIAFDPQSNAMYVANASENMVMRFDNAGRQIASRVFPAMVSGVAITGDGRLLVTQRDRVAVCDKDMNKVSEIGAGEFSQAYAIAIDGSGYIYVTDSRAQKVRIYTAGGQFVKAFGGGGHADGQFMTPTAIVYEKGADQIVVVDTNNYRIQFFTTAGVHVKSISKNSKSSSAPYAPVPGFNPLQFTMPMGVAFEYGIDPATGKEVARRMYVTDSYQVWVQVIDPNYKDPTTGAWGQFLSFIKYAEGAPGDMSNPSDTVFDGVNRRLLVCNALGYISIYGIDGGKSPSASEPPVLTVDSAPSQTAQQILTLNGSVGAGAAVGVANAADGSSGAATVSGTAWNYQLTLVPGANSITITATDPATGLSATKTTEITYLAPLSLTLNPLPAYSNTPAQVMSGNVDAGAAVTVTNVTSGATATATLNGTTWSCQIALIEGGNSLVVSATKASYVSAGASVVVTLDAVAPELSVNGAADASYTNIQTHTITGTVADANLSQATINGQPLNVQGGAFSTSFTLAEGANTITVQASDLAGNKTTDSRTVTYDATAPALTVSALPDGSYTNNPTQNITGAVVEANLGQVTVNGRPVEVINGTFSTSVTLGAGTNAIEVAATDLAGNKAGDSRTIIFDITAPTIGIASPADGSYTKEAVATISGSVDETVTYVNVGGMAAQLDGTAWSAEVSLSQGLNTIEIVAVDLAGNIGSAKRSVTFDNVAPQVAITVPNQDLATNSASISISGAASDSEPFTLTRSFNSESTTLTVAADGSYDTTVTFPAEGSYPVTLVATDAAGNTSAATRTVTYDATPPELTIDPVNTARPTKLSGTIEAGAVVNIHDKNGKLATPVGIANGSWSADISTAAFDVTTLAAVAADPAGNTAIRALTFKFPDGDLDGDGAVTHTDFQIAQRIWTHELIPTAGQLAHGDIGPLVNGLPCPDGRIEKTDAELIQQKATGKISW